MSNRERKAKANEDKYYFNSQSQLSKTTFIIHMKHYHTKHFIFLSKVQYQFE